MNDLLLRNVRPMAGETCDVLIRDGKLPVSGVLKQSRAWPWKTAATLSSSPA